ncbi:Zn-ribbon domain-containing OB-fold protein [Mycolicibacterium sp. ELW1]|uniref:Zn-ribbon domain-containing OB-fold protein n=1 Tax=Mycobacteriaceae TaxID=1762 RepID=UPI0011ED3706|nr:OB-fold domain-containing protein [Mycobacterium sp. ELW1]QEN12943.1 DNA-binding protein [Mycobacterium sp. ELW1]
MPETSLDELPTLGSIGPRADGIDIPFWEGLRVGELRMQRCTDCAAWWWFPVWRCGDCGSWTLHWQATPVRGVVRSWIRTHHAFAPEMAGLVPYINVLVELPDAGNRRLLGLLIGDDEELAIDAEVEGVIQKPSELTNNEAVLRWKLVGR